MTFSVTSNSFKDGDYLGKDFVLSADFGFGCAGGAVGRADPGAGDFADGAAQQCR